MNSSQTSESGCLAMKGFRLSIFLLTLFSLSAMADENTALAKEYPELQQLLLAHDIVQARVYEEISLANASDIAPIGQRVLLDTLAELKKSKNSHYHSAGDHSAMLGPHRVFESRAIPGLLGVVRGNYNADEVSTALADVGNLPPVAVETLQKGRQFIELLIEIYINPAFEDKKAAVALAVESYLQNDRLAIASKPKSDELLSDHAWAYAFKVGFPQLSGLTWASQWLKLGTLELLVTEPDVAARNQAIAYLLELYNEKINRLHGSLVSLPTDIPTSPVIAPSFFELHPDAAYIIDNLELLKVVIGDILAYPEVADRWQEIELAVQNYTDKTSNLSDETDYLYYTLRGGIYNAGGPARGGLNRPDRNWSREQSENPHISIGTQPSPD